MTKVTELARAYNADGHDKAHIIAYVSEDIAQDMIDDYELDTTQAQAMALEIALHPIVAESIDWGQLEQDDENARDWEDARRSAIYK